MEKYYVWLVPEAREVLLEDSCNPPLWSLHLSIIMQSLINDLGGHRDFDSYEDALEYAKKISDNMNWYLNINTEATRSTKQTEQFKS